MDTADDFCVVVTGASSGIGLQLTLELAKGGHEVVMACRDVDKANKAKAEMLAAWPTAQLVVLQLDLVDLSSVVRFAQDLASATTKPLVALVNNAGMMADFSDTKINRLPNGFELTMATNHFGSALLSFLLLPALNESARTLNTNVRIVNVTSRLHKIETCRSIGSTVDELNVNDLNYAADPARYSGLQAYKDSKAAAIMFANVLSRVVSERCEVYSVCPGFVPSTGLGRNSGRVKMALVRVVVGYVLPLVGKKVAVSVESAAVALALAATGRLDPLAHPLPHSRGFYFENDGVADVLPAQPAPECLKPALANACFNQTVRLLRDALRDARLNAALPFLIANHD